MRTSNAGVVGDSNSAYIIESYSCNFTGAARPVLVVAVVSRHGIQVVVIDVGTGTWVLHAIFGIRYKHTE